MFDRFLADVEPARDLGGIASLRQQAQHLDFPFGQIPYLAGPAR